MNLSSNQNGVKRSFFKFASIMKPWFLPMFFITSLAGNFISFVSLSCEESGAPEFSLIFVIFASILYFVLALGLESTERATKVIAYVFFFFGVFLVFHEIPLYLTKDKTKSYNIEYLFKTQTEKNNGENTINLLVTLIDKKTNSKITDLKYKDVTVEEIKKYKKLFEGVKSVVKSYEYVPFVTFSPIYEYSDKPLKSKTKEKDETK